MPRTPADRWQTGPLRLCPPELHLLRACAQRVAAVYRLPEPPVPARGLTFFYVDRVVYSGSVSTQPVTLRCPCQI
jgi:hypothetical protein